MEITNYPADIKKYGLLEASDIVLADDLIMIGKKVTPLRNGTKYIDIPMTLLEFATLFGGGGAQTLAQTLAFGNSTGNLFIVAPDNTSKFGILSGGQLDWSADNGVYAQSWIYGDSSTNSFGFSNNYLNVNISEIELISGPGQISKIHADPNAVWIASFYDQRGFYVTDTPPPITGKIVAITTTELLVKHDVQITLDSPTINFPQIASLSIGNAVLYTDASGNLIPITPTTNGFVLTLVGGIPDWAATPGPTIDTITNNTLSSKPLLLTGVTNLDTTGGGSGTFTLADGTEGQTKKIVLTTLGVPVIVIPANLRDYGAVAVTQIAFSNVGDAVELVFNDGKWTVIASSPSTIVS